LFRQVRETVGKDGSGTYRAVITHGDDEETAARLGSLIKDELKQVEVVFTHRMNDIIGVPAGPDCLAVAISPD
jgi:fatty acid-binding protein DegV